MSKYMRWLSGQRGFDRAPEREIRSRMLRRFPELPSQRALSLILLWKQRQGKRGHDTG